MYETGEIIPNSYLVVFKKDTDFGLVKEFAAKFEAKRAHEIGDFKAFTGTFNERAIAAIRQLDVVEFVEKDQVMRAYACQSGATWGIDRIDQQNLPLNSQYCYPDANGAPGSGVNAYIIDTGIRNTHSDFGGRSKSGYDFHNNKPDATDDNGHGTHVASTTAGTTWGVAKNATLYGVKVLGAFGSGSTTNVVAGVDFTAQQHRASNNKKTVANMSLGGGASAAMDNAVNAAVSAGVSFALASGNSNANACNSSPARVGGPSGTSVTVNAADQRDARASFSNFGTCTDIFAPGVSITAAWHTSDTVTNTISGTSMASPHVCGAMAVYMTNNPQTPAQVKAFLMNEAVRGVISNPGTGSTNANLYQRY